jgi:putative FmdB family regulatory protein
VPNRRTTVPTYQYVCTECGRELEAVQSFTDAPLTECPACHGKLRKVFSAVGVVFKGSGFYRTDSRDGAKAGDGKGGDGKGGDKAAEKAGSSSGSSGDKAAKSSSDSSSSSSTSSSSSGSSSGSGSSGSSGSSSSKPAA